MVIFLSFSILTWKPWNLFTSISTVNMLTFRLQHICNPDDVMIGDQIGEMQDYNGGSARDSALVSLLPLPE